jgi:peroxiredoxin Q/BCP
LTRGGYLLSSAFVITSGQKLSVNFPLKIVQNGAVHERMFPDLLRRRTIVSIYMRNNTPSCDRQIEALAEHGAEFDRMGYDLIAISRDTAGSHKRRAEKLGPAAGGLVLASDPKDLFASAADAVVDKVLYGRKYRGPVRSAFVLAADATVLAVIEKVEPMTHAEQLRAAVAGLSAR